MVLGGVRASRASKMFNLRKRAGQTHAGIIQDDARRSKHMVKTVHAFRALTKAQKKRYDLQGWDTPHGKARIYDGRIVRRYARAMKVRND